jgi:dihydroorotase
MDPLLLKNAHVTDPAAGVDGVRDVLVANGCIGRVDEAAPLADLPRGTQVVDCAGLWLWPGLVDVHVHFREPGFTRKETLRTGSQAAAAGGYSSVVCEPNTEPAIDSVEIVRRLADQAAREACVNVYFKAAMTVGREGREPTRIADLAREPVVVALSDDGDPLVDPAVMAAVCRAAAEAGIPVSPHEEDSPRSLRAYNEGKDPGFEPAAAFANEANYVRRDLDIARRAGCRVHFSHVSRADVLALIGEARRSGEFASRVSLEAAPHHLLLYAEAFAEGDVPTVNPPLRSAADRDALAQALLDGRIDAVASDHAPHTAADKAAGACGLIGLETTLGLMLTEFVGRRGWNRQAAVRAMSLQPARIFGLTAGTLRPGAPADIVLIDPSREWTIEPDRFRSRSRNTPYAGMRLTGKAVATFVAGSPVYAEPACGALVGLRERMERT